MQPASAPDISDEQVVVLALTDRSYYRLLYERYADRVYWYARVRTGSDEAADDVVSETMLAALENLHRFDPARGTFAAWLFVIGRRKTVDHQRAHHRVLRLLARVRGHAGPGTAGDALEDVVAAEQAAEVQRALRGLSREDREILALRYSAGLSGPEIAAILNVSHEAARKRLSRAVGRFRKQIERDGTER